jgi:hypothetical protein
MQNLQFVCEQLARRGAAFDGSYFIPEVWNAVGWERYATDQKRPGQIRVNPYEFLSHIIGRHILPHAEAGKDYLRPLDRGSAAPPELHQCVIYGALLRTFTAWDHVRPGQVCPGSFIKTIGLLPYLRKLGVNILYLLPVFATSDRYKKGECGSPYAIRDSYRLDRNLHDDLLGEADEAMVATEFKALIEACHILGIRVMVDFVFRTVARDHALLADHPEWFYWIRRRTAPVFAPPAVAGEGKLTLLNDGSLKSLYTCDGIAEYLAQFTVSPPEIDPARWRRLLERHRRSGANLLALIEEEYQITTAPGFSNVLNDPQPPWTDVTYLRLYQDTHPKARPYLPREQPPYILQDVACANLYPGRLPNRGLWDYLLGIIPHYQEEYGIDGARIDMGHALPPELNQAIVARVKAANPHFILWSEEFAPEHSRAARENGFHFISGNLWSVYNDVDQPRFRSRLLRIVSSAALPVTAALETPDTPRMALVYRERPKLSLLLLLNCFIANAVPFINSGMELLELQPMNLGLNNDEMGRFVLDREDPMYGKLAFFDHYRLHWLNQDHSWLRELLAEALRIRRRFGGLVGNRVHLRSRPLKNSKIIFFWYFDPKTGQNLFFLANRSFAERARVRLQALFPEEFLKDRPAVAWLYPGSTGTGRKWEYNQWRFLAPGEVRIGYLRESYHS